MAATSKGAVLGRGVSHEELVQMYCQGLLRAQEHISFLYKRLESDEWDDAMNDMVSQLHSMTTLKKTAEDNALELAKHLTEVKKCVQDAENAKQVLCRDLVLAHHERNKALKELASVAGDLKHCVTERKDARECNDISRDVVPLVELQGLREKYDALVDDMGRNEEVHHKLHHELQQRFAEVQQTLHRDLDLAHRQHNEVHARCDELNETLSVRTEQVEMLERQRDQACRVNNTLEDQIVALRDACGKERDRVLTNLNTAIDERNEAREQAGAAHDKLRWSKDDVRTWRKRYETAIALRNTYGKKLDALQDDMNGNLTIKRLRNERNAAITERDSAVARIDLVVDERHRAHDKLANVREDLLRVIAERKDFLERWRKEEKHAGAVVSALNGAVQERDDARRALNDMTTSRDRVFADLNTAIAERDKLQESYEIVTAERDQARQARDINAGIDSEYRTLRDKVADARAARDKAIQASGATQQALVTVEAQRDRVSEQLTDVGKQLADCREDRWKWQQEANDYRERYANTVQMNRSLNADLRRRKIAKQFAEQVQDGND